MNTMKKPFLILGGLALAFTLGIVSAAAYVRHQGFITVRVCERAPNGDDVSVRIPAALVDLSLPLLPRFGGCGGGFCDFEKEARGFRTILRELKSLPDCDLVTVDAPYERVRIRKTGGDLIVDVQDHGDLVYVSMPVRVAEKLVRRM
jgi:hypothetical protein